MGVLLHFYSFFCKLANMVDPGQTPRFLASDVGLDFLHNIPKRVFSLKRVKELFFTRDATLKDYKLCTNR